MLQWIGPLIVAGTIGLVVAMLVVVAGVVDLSARKPHPEGWGRFLHFTFDRSTAFHRGPPPPADLDSPIRIAAGAAYYGQVCAHCHGGPGFGQNPVVLSMHPRPQYLVTDLRAAGFSPRELFRIVHAGVKYSAMPGWPASRRPDEIWHLVAFLRALPSMSPERFRALALIRPQPGPAIAPAVATPRPYHLINNAEPPVTSYSYAWPSYAFGDQLAQTGNPIATCARCHGANGAGGGAFPNLTLQDPQYLRRTLAAYAAGRRESGFMRVIASQLSPQQIAALAAYYTALPRRATDPAGVDPVGQRLVLRGDPARGLGPCAGCHGIDRATAKAYPLLEGQSAWYLANQLRIFAGGGRGGIEGLNPMTAVARRMTPAQIDAVARYYAGQAPAARQNFAEIRAR